MKITQKAQYVVTVTGPVTIRGTEVMNETGEVVAQVGITFHPNPDNCDDEQEDR